MSNTLTPEEMVKAIAAKRRRLAKKARSNEPLYYELVIRDERSQKRIQLAPHHQEWITHVAACRERGEYPGILAPVGSGKSQIFSVARPIRLLGEDPTACITIASNNRQTAKKRVKAARDYVVHSEDFAAVYPHCAPKDKDTWTEYAFVVERPAGIKDPSYQAFGITMPPTGTRSKHHLNDDVCDHQNTIGEPAMRTKVIDNWYNLFDNRLDRESTAAHIGTVIHQEDLNMVLSVDPRWNFIVQRIGPGFDCIEQENLKTGERKTFPLWEARWDADWLRRQHAANPRAFDRAYRNQGFSDSDTLFDRDSVERSRVIGRGPDLSDLTIVGGVDLSSSKRPGNWILYIGVDQNNIRWLVDGRRGAWKSHETAQNLCEMSTELHARMTFVENNAYQQALLDWMGASDLPPVALEGFTTGSSKNHESLGVPGLAAEFRAGMWRIPMGNDAHGVGCECWRCELLRALVSWPYGESDPVMALWLARQAALKYGSGGEYALSDHGPGKTDNRGRMRSRAEEMRARLREQRNMRRRT
jgi:hypothetical protein